MILKHFLLSCQVNMIDRKQKISIEKEFISLLLKYKDLVSEWRETGPDRIFFDNNHKYILEAIIESFNNDVLLTRKTFESFLEKRISVKSDIVAQGYLYLSTNSIPVKRDDFPNLKDKITEAFLSKKAISAIEEFRDIFSKKGAGVATKSLLEKLKNLVDDTKETKQIYYESITDYSEEYYEKLVEKRNRGADVDVIRSHIKEIDEAMVVGFAPGTLTLFCGDVGGFKSAQMLNVGSNIWQFSKKNVLFVPLEMPREKMFQKFVSRFLKIPFDRIEHPTLLTEDELKKIGTIGKSILDIDIKNNSKFFIMEAPDQIKVSVIRREIEKHIDIFKPNVVIIDYIVNLVPDGNDRNDLEIGYMLKALRTMGKPGGMTHDGFAIVSGAQIGREALKRIRRSAANKMAFYSEDLRGSHEYSADADNIFAQMEDPQQPQSRLNIYVIKARYGKKIFNNGSIKASLEVKPEISLIQSVNDSFYKVKHEEIMNKINSSNDLNFEENKTTEKSITNDVELDKILGL